MFCMLALGRGENGQEETSSFLLPITNMRDRMVSMPLPLASHNQLVLLRPQTVRLLKLGAPKAWRFGG